MVEVQPPSKRAWGIVAAVVVVAAAGFLLAFTSGGAGPGEVVDTEDAFADADERFHVDEDGAVSRTHSFEVGPGIAAMTVSRSLDLPAGGEWRLIDPDGDRRGTISPQIEGTAITEPTGAHVVHRPDPGTWQMEVSCEDGCTYTLGVYLSDALSPPTEDLAEDIAGADTTVQVDHDSSVSRTETFEVPEGTQALEIEVSFYAADGATFQIQPASGGEDTRWSWGAEWLTRGTTYVVAERPQAGTWQIDYACSDGCQGAWGFTFVRPPSS